MAQTVPNASKLAVIFFNVVGVWAPMLITYFRCGTPAVTVQEPNLTILLIELAFVLPLSVGATFLFATYLIIDI
jgi:hypothetical protein